MKPGTQIIYVPNHANGDLDHPACESGFVTGDAKDGNVFCRYWSRFVPNELRTKANSESTPVAHLIMKDTKPQFVINNLLQKYKYTP